MSSEIGGRANRLGIGFERLWTVRHLIELLPGRAVSVRIEAIGDDECGTEFWVSRDDGTREAHQCKRENGITGKWSTAALEARGVIANAARQLARDPTHRFHFVSGDRAPLLSDLTERARRSDDVAEYYSQGVTTSVHHRREFEEICRRLGRDPAQAADLDRVVDFLRRLHCRVADKEMLRDEVEELALRWIDGDPKQAVAALADLTEQRLGRTVYRSDVVAHLPPGHRPRDLANDPALTPAMDELRARFDRSYRGLLIGDRVLGRPESDELFTRVVATGGTRLILVHGAGGDGKSGVGFEAVSRLAKAGVTCLPLRLDRDKPEDSPLQYGRRLDLPASPVACLAAEADGRPGVLLLDQVDAVRWTSAHSAHAWDTVERLVAEALRHPNLRVVVMCRSFDVEDDRRIKAWTERHEAGLLKVGPLDDATVDRVVAAAGVPATTISPGQRRVLRSPQGLHLWCTLHASGCRTPVFRTATDLMRRFWEHVRGEELPGLVPGRYQEVLDAVVGYMDGRGTLAAPRTVVAAWDHEVRALLSLNVLVEGPGRRLLFAHQSSLDHLTAERVLREVHAGSGSVVDWLKKHDQSLFRRGQLRQLLTLLRDDDPTAYVDALRSILNGEGIRFHLRHLALQLLGHADPVPGEEVGLVLDLARNDAWIDHLYSHVLTTGPAWFDALNDRGVLQGWLDGPDEKRRNLATAVIERVVGTRGDAVASLVLSGTDQRVRRERLQAVVWRTPPEKLTPRLFRAYVRMAHGGPQGAQLVDWKRLAIARPRRFVRLLEACLHHYQRACRSAPDGSAERWLDSSSLLVRETLDAAAAAAAAVPAEAWDRLVPCLRRAVRARASLRVMRYRGDVRYLYDRQEQVRRILHLLSAVLGAAGAKLARVAPDVFWEYVNALGDVRSQ